MPPPLEGAEAVAVVASGGVPLEQAARPTIIRTARLVTASRRFIKILTRPFGSNQLGEELWRTEDVERD
ncbi:hypothetical protein ACFOLD_08345 [Kocuria carniphila]|uniref:hypothetical protein n=1 Tax=Kocuria carniphila TaxID=262208 RepID=UPI0036236854